MKTFAAKNGASVVFDDSPDNNPRYVVRFYRPNGTLADKMRCDTRQSANEYYRSFCKIAKNGVYSNETH